jgi:two-component system response regulator HydG
VDIRLITTISRDARSAIEDGCLLEGLHNRINAVELHIPPLRERPEDVPVLAKRFLKKHTAAEEEPAVIFTVAALEFLQSLPWHGNVAELESLVQRVLVFSDRGRVDVAELERVVRAPADGGPPTLAGMPDAWRSASSAGGHFKNLAEQEREAIRAALIRARGNKSKAARLLGIHRNTLLRRMKKLRISWKRSAVGPADPGGIGRRYAPW